MVGDWLKHNYHSEIRVDMVDPHDLTKVLGTLEGVDLADSSLSWGYYADTRVSGSISTIDDNYIDHSLLRIVHLIPEWDYEQPLATLWVKGDDTEYTNGVWKTTYDLMSAMATLQNDYTTTPLTVDSGAMYIDVVKHLLEGANRPYKINNPRDYRFMRARVYEMGDSRMSNIFDMTTATKNRVNVDPLGYVTINRWDTPAEREPIFKLELEGEQTNVIESISRTSDRLQTENMVIVSAGTEDKTVVGWARSNGEESFAARGYTLAKVVSLDNLSPLTKARADQEAESRLKSAVLASTEWSFDCLYLPLTEGDVITMSVPEGKFGGDYKCLVKNVELNLEYMTISIKLKDIQQGYVEESEDVM